jgi:predicted porin
MLHPSYADSQKTDLNRTTHALQVRTVYVLSTSRPENISGCHRMYYGAFGIFLSIDQWEKMMKKIMVVALWASAFASFSAFAEHKLHPADVMDSGQIGAEIVAGSSSLSADYRLAGFNIKQEIDTTLVDAALRYGVTDSLELHADLPYMQEKTEISGSVNSTEKHSCFGDASLGAAFKPLSATSRGVDLVAKLDIQPQSADSNTCGNGYTRTSFDLVISKPFGDWRPYIDLAMNNRNKDGADSKSFELGTEWRVSPVLALDASYNWEKYDASTFVDTGSQQTIGIGAAYALQKNMWLFTQFGRVTAKDFQATTFSNNDTSVTNAKQNIFLVGLQILY